MLCFACLQASHQEIERAEVEANRLVKGSIDMTSQAAHGKRCAVPLTTSRVHVVEGGVQLCSLPAPISFDCTLTPLPVQLDPGVTIDHVMS